jgi:pyrroline-5-carboxylate reductase
MFFKQTYHLTQQTPETTEVATARTSESKETQVQEAQHITLAIKPQGNTLQSLPLPHHPELTRSQLIFSIATSIDP